MIDESKNVNDFYVINDGEVSVNGANVNVNDVEKVVDSGVCGPNIVTNVQTHCM